MTFSATGACVASLTAPHTSPIPPAARGLSTTYFSATRSPGRREAITVRALITPFEGFHDRGSFASLRGKICPNRGGLGRDGPPSWSASLAPLTTPRQGKLSAREPSL